MKMIFEISEKFRAGILEKVGYVFCTPICIVFLNWLLSGFVITAIIVKGFIASLFLFAIGYMFVSRAYDAMYDLDLRIRRM